MTAAKKTASARSAPAAAPSETGAAIGTSTRVTPAVDDAGERASVHRGRPRSPAREELQKQATGVLRVDRRRKPVNPSPDRVGLRARADSEVRDVLVRLQGLSEEEQLSEVGRLTNEAFEAEKATMRRAAAAALSSDFYDGSRFNLAPLLGVTTTSWAERRRRALQVPEPRWLRNASREELAARARQMGIPHLPAEEDRLVELGVEAVAAQERKAALAEERNAMIRRMYTATYTNPQGRTQPQLAKLAGISDRLVWHIINPLSERRAAKKAAARTGDVSDAG